MTPEERESIICEAVERAMLILPDVWSNLVTEHKAMAGINKKFYGDNPQFKGNEEAVVSCMNEIDGKYPNLPYEDKIEKAKPLISERIKQLQQFDVKTVTDNPSRTFEPINRAVMDNNGDI